MTVPAKKEDCMRFLSVVAASGLSGKAITDVTVSQHGSVTAIEVTYSGGSKFIKERQGLVEVGGDLNWGSGTQVF
jgi:hypothetical protein